MTPTPKRTTDPERQRCTACGHPRREHRPSGCTVPRCACRAHVEAASPASGRTA